MAVEYDLIVIGGSTAGVYAAVAAAHLQARVALVAPQLAVSNGSMTGAIYSKALTQVGQLTHQLRDLHQFGVHWETADATKPNQVSTSIRFTEAIQWAEGVVSTLEEKSSPAVLASLGVDVIVEAGEFCRKPHLAFVVNNRRLRARSYLLATDSRPAVTEIDGLEATGYVTPADIWQNASLPRCWVVIGGVAAGVELAQTLVRLGAEVTLVVKGVHVLTKEDSEAALLVQAQLEAEGIHVLTRTEVTQVRRIEDKKWVQAGNKAIEVDEILLCTGQLPNVEALNLEGVGVKMHRKGFQLNEKLQTTNPRIYACGSGVSYQFPHIAEYEANIALKNALFLPIYKVDDHGIPTAVFSDPQLARVGLTEAQALYSYGKDVVVLRQYFKAVSKAQLIGETTGFCKILVRRNGQILGATIVGSESAELIHLLALAIREKIKVSAIAQLSAISPTRSEIIAQTSAEWHRQRLNSKTGWQDFLEGFFQLRRNWSS